MDRLLKRLQALLLCGLVLTACSRQNDHLAQGYIEGRYTYVATSVSGVLEQLAVHRGKIVQQGDLLFKLEDQPESDLYRNALETYNENLAARDSIKANLTFAKLTFERYKILVPKGAIQQSQLDDAKAAYQSLAAQLSQANANIAAAKASLAQARWTLDQKTIRANTSGFIFDTYYRKGERTIANDPVISMLVPENIKAIFYIREPMLSRLKLGQKVFVHCHGCPKYEGTISFIAPNAEYTPPIIYSTETNSKFVFRIEARFDKNTAQKLHPGQPVTVDLNI